jgi:hypothetical protein
MSNQEAESDKCTKSEAVINSDMTAMDFIQDDQVFFETKSSRG